MDYRISARTHEQAVAKAADTLAVPLPGPYLEQVAKAQAFADAAGQIGLQSEDLYAAVFAAIEAGRDYRSDETVQRMALDRLLTTQNIGERSRGRCDELLAAALADHGDGILAGWADALEPHTAALVAAAEAVPGLDLRHGHTAATHGGDVLRHWASARTALDAWTAAERGFYALATVAGVSYTGHGPLVLTPARKADLEPASDLARKERTEVDAWVLARRGIVLELATLGDFMARVATFKADRQAEDRARAERAAAAGFNR